MLALTVWDVVLALFCMCFRDLHLPTLFPRFNIGQILDTHTQGAIATAGVWSKFLRAKSVIVLTDSALYWKFSDKCGKWFELRAKIATVLQTVYRTNCIGGFESSAKIATVLKTVYRTKNENGMWNCISPTTSPLASPLQTKNLRLGLNRMSRSGTGTRNCDSQDPRISKHGVWAICADSYTQAIENRGVWGVGCGGGVG